jgi:hypothetical protein
MPPFLAAGLFTISAGLKAHAHGDAQWMIAVAVGAAFTIFAIGFASMALYALRRSRPVPNSHLSLNASACRPVS